MLDPSENSQQSTENPDAPTFRPFQEGDLVRIRKVNGCFPRDSFTNLPISREVIGELGKKSGGNIFEVYVGPGEMRTVDLAYLELVSPAEENGDHFFLDHVPGLSYSRYVIYHGSFREPTFVCAFSDKYYTKEKAEEEIAILSALNQQPVKKN